MSDRDELTEGTEPEAGAAPASESVTPGAAAEPAAPTTAPVSEAEVASAPVAAAAASGGEATAPAAQEQGSEATSEPRRKGRPVKPSSLQPLPPYAIIETGGKQYRVSVGDVVSVEKLPVEDGSTITFDRVLLLGGDGETRVGTPTVAGASVEATVAETYRGEKLVIFKYKAKKRYRRKTGHRQTLTRLAITAINA